MSLFEVCSLKFHSTFILSHDEKNLPDEKENKVHFMCYLLLSLPLNYQVTV